MIEVPQEQLATIFELACQAASMSTAAHHQAIQQVPRPEGPGGADTEAMAAILPASPLAAEIFKTLVRCHVDAKRDRAMQEFQNKVGGPNPGALMGMPPGLGKI